jgi:hypothetical protein
LPYYGKIKNRTKTAMIPRSERKVINCLEKVKVLGVRISRRGAGIEILVIVKANVVVYLGHDHSVSIHIIM